MMFLERGRKRRWTAEYSFFFRAIQHGHRFIVRRLGIALRSLAVAAKNRTPGLAGMIDFQSGLIHFCSLFGTLEKESDDLLKPSWTTLENQYAYQGRSETLLL